jgi:hypothetical protein
MVRFLVLSVALGLPALAASKPVEGPPGLSREEALAREKSAGTDPKKLVELAGMVDAAHARKLLQRVYQLLQQEKGADRADARTQFTRILPRVARSPMEVKEVLGAPAPAQVSRQLFYRRYREVWVYASPFGLVVIFDCVRGNDPYLYAVVSVPGVKI